MIAPGAPKPGGGGPRPGGGAGGRRGNKRQGPFGEQLREKQNLKGFYGIREEQLRKYFRNARKHTGNTGQELIRQLESRLDNAIFRSGMAETRQHARQMASHKIFLVNGKPVNIPSLQLKKGDMVTVKESKRKNAYFSNYEKKMQGAKTPSWILNDTENFGFKVTDAPDPEEGGAGVAVQSVVELLAR